MMSILLVTTIMIVQCFAGEVERLNYEPKYGFNKYRTSTKNDDKRVISTTPNGHQFSLAIDYRRYTEYSSGLFRMSSVVGSKYQNIVQIYYRHFPLESIKIPAIDSLEDCSLSSIDKKVFQSIHPRVPTQDVRTPSTIFVYYSLTNGDCVRGIYSLTSLYGTYYEKDYKDKIVNKEDCN